MKQTKLLDDLQDLVTEVMDLHARLSTIEKMLEKCNTLKHICTCPCDNFHEDEAQPL